MWIKICGITSAEDAELAISAGADAIGLNFVPVSSRAVDHATARRIVSRVSGRVEVVGVVADLPVARARALRDAVGLSWLQLHGQEPPEDLEALGPAAYKAVRLGERADLLAASAYRGERLLVDAKVEGVLGGTGVAADWALAAELARTRSVILAGGLGPENVAQAIEEVRPWGVDVASGVERAGRPRHKDPDRLAAFVSAARGASAGSLI